MHYIVSAALVCSALCAFLFYRAAKVGSDAENSHYISLGIWEDTDVSEEGQQA